MKTRLLLAGVCLIAMITGCAGSNTVAPSDEKTETVATTNQGANVVENSDERTVTVPKEKADILEKYPELISYLESEDYQSAEAYVHDLVLQQKKEAAGDIEDYLVTVDLNSENFDDYFEFTTIPSFTVFGEPDGFLFAVKSKEYENGLIIYSMDEIAVELSILDEELSEQDHLKDLLSLTVTSVFRNQVSSEQVHVGRVGDGKITFIKQEYVEEYPIPEPKTPDVNCIETTIKLKNGEQITRYINPANPY